MTTNAIISAALCSLLLTACGSMATDKTANTASDYEYSYET